MAKILANLLKNNKPAHPRNNNVQVETHKHGKYAKSQRQGAKP